MRYNSFFMGWLTILIVLFSCSREKEERHILQAGSVPGKWEQREEAYPPFESIKNKPANPLPVYGLYTWCGEYREHRESIKQVGWKVLRVAGPLDDTTFAMLVEDGMDVMMTVGLYATGQKKRRDDYASDEEFITAYIGGLETFLKRYGPGGAFFKEHPELPVRPVKEIEIFNEPNFQYIIPDREPRAAVEGEREVLYAKILPAAYTVIKMGWPAVKVVGFAAGGSGAGDVRFIQAVHDKIGNPAERYDVLSTHPYLPPCPPEVFQKKPDWPSKGYSAIGNLASIRTIMKDHGCENKPVYYTEVGWPVAQKDGGHFDTPDTKNCVSPELQAAYVVRQYIQSMRLGVDKTMIMYVTDSDGFNGGFFLRDGSWRPSATVVQFLIKMMPHPRMTRVISEGNSGFFAYGFRPDVNGKDDEVVVAWTTAGTRDVDIPVKGRWAKFYDMVGHMMKIKVLGGKAGVTVGPYPVYIKAK